MSLGKWLKKIRLEKGVKSKDLAIAIGMHPSNYSRLEADKVGYKPSYKVIKKIKQHLALSDPEWREILIESDRVGDQMNESLKSNRPDLSIFPYPDKNALLLDVYRMKRSVAGGKSFPWHATLHYECERILEELGEKTFSIAPSINKSRAEKISDLLYRLSQIRRLLNLPEIENLEVING